MGELERDPSMCIRDDSVSVALCVSMRLRHLELGAAELFCSSTSEINLAKNAALPSVPSLPYSVKPRSALTPRSPFEFPAPLTPTIRHCLSRTPSAS